MVAGCGAKIAKFILFVINFLVWVVGIILIGVGAYAMVEASKYSYLFGDEDTLTTVAAFMIGVGVIIFIVGFCGCCGAVKQSPCLLKIYFALVLLVIILEVVAAVMAFVFKDDLKEVVEENIMKIIETEYNGMKDNIPTETLDRLQMEFSCCGGAGVADWGNSTWAKDEMVAAPTSCCKDTNEANCNAGSPGVGSDMLNTEGCVETFEDWIEGNYLMVGGVCIGLLLFEILALIFTCCLIKAVETEEKGL